MKPFLTAALFLILAAHTAGVRAADEPPPTVVESQSLDMHSTDTETLSVFTGNVVVTGANMRITCDRLDVVSMRLGDKTDTIGKQEKFKSLVASGRVRIVQGDREASCDRAEVLPREDKVTLTGNPVVIDHGNGTVATGEPLVLLRGERRVTGKNVHITMPPIKDLGYDKNQPPPAPDISPTSAPSTSK